MRRFTIKRSTGERVPRALMGPCLAADCTVGWLRSIDSASIMQGRLSSHGASDESSVSDGMMGALSCHSHGVKCGRNHSQLSHRIDQTCLNAMRWPELFRKAALVGPLSIEGLASQERKRSSEDRPDTHEKSQNNREIHLVSFMVPRDHQTQLCFTSHHRIPGC